MTVQVAPGAQNVAPRRRATWRRRDTRAGYIFLSPWLIGFFVLTAGPMVASLVLSFTDYDLFSTPSLVGFANYTRLWTDSNYLQAVKVTVLYVAIGAPLKLIVALAVALLLNSARGGSGFYRSGFYLPSLIGGSVSIAIIWKAMFIDNGVVASIGSFFGGPPAESGGWVGNPSMTLPMLILLTVWQFGAPMVIFLAGLKQVPTELLEAASVDGAGRVRRFIRVTLPMISPVLFFNLLLELIHAFQIFNSAFIISNGTGGPVRSTLFYTLYLYQRGFQDFQMGYASAMAWVLLIVVGLVTFMLFRTSKAWVHYAGDEK